ncbi:MAG: 50S ribosomal protein L5 [Lentisphaerae bacterium]|nr:50S ribosomal protein L5 [Lentisphaerota bacterium]
MSGLQEKYKTELALKLKENLGLKNIHAVPRVVKVVVNMGLGNADKDQIKNHAEELAMITGQRPVLTKAKKSISNFKLREGAIVGAKVTLRGARMYEFLDRLISAALPRIRDFRGVSSDSFDEHGNYTMGIREQTIFPEIDLDKVGAVQGMDITIVTSADDKSSAFELLKILGMPFAKN